MTATKERKKGSMDWISFWIRVYKSFMVNDCFELMAFATMAGVSFVCVPMVDIFVFLLSYFYFEPYFP